jgi:hypothetical protein
VAKKGSTVSASAVLDDPRPRVVMTISDIDPERMMLEGVNLQPLDPVLKKPKKLMTFSVGEIAKTFFGKSPDWVRWREAHGYLTLDGEKVGVGRTTPVDANGKKTKTKGQRRYTLADVEKIAHALAEKGAIDSVQLIAALRIIEQIAIMYGIIPYASDEG